MVCNEEYFYRTSRSNTILKKVKVIIGWMIVQEGEGVSDWSETALISKEEREVAQVFIM